jgi:hypothetical protein
LQFEVHPDKKVSKILSQKESWAWWITTIISAMWKTEVGEP